MYATQTMPRCFSFVLLGMLTAVVIGQSLRKSRGSLAGATKQYEERWQAVHDFSPTRQERDQHGILTFTIITVIGSVGVFQGLKERKK